MSESIYIIYKYTSPSGKSYIGQTKNPIQRKRSHKNSSSMCRYFSNAIQKYGWDNFTYEVLVENLSLQEANNLEEQLILEHNTLVPSGYNLRSGGENKFVSEETKQLISIANKGRNPWVNRNFSGHSPETRRKLSIANTGKPSAVKGIKKGPLPDNIKQKISDANSGRVWTEEQKAKLRKPKVRAKTCCPHCGKIGDVSGMTRYHFDNCKLRPIN